MKHFPRAAVPAIICGLAALALATVSAPADTPAVQDQAPAVQEEWPLFDSSSVTPPYQGPGFTVRYPPNFNLKTLTDTPPEGPWSAVAEFSLGGAGAGPFSDLHILLYAPGPGGAPPADPGAAGRYWDGIGRELAEKTGAKFLRHAGATADALPAVDMFFTRSLARGQKALGAMRAYPRGEGFVLASCTFSTGEANEKGWGTDGVYGHIPGAFCMRSLETFVFKER
ncbi:MAG: hypothetical protein LBT40_17065 [Deltaproteobacteria bacterium]|nr:hypothetical protein [Deltaproteobacteria bacterium]